MKRFLQAMNRWLVQAGLDVRVTIAFIKGLPAYTRDRRVLKSQSNSASTEIPFGRSYPCLGEQAADSGVSGGHYFHQDILVARRIFVDAPKTHVDVGSRIDGFVAHVASFRMIEVLDIRPQTGAIPNVTFVQADMMPPLEQGLVAYCDSLSCLHALEHFGLGRYGDPVCYDGYLRGIANLRSLLKVGGTLYLSVPIGPQRIEFNAHRVFSVSHMLECLARGFELERFSFVDDAGDLHEDRAITRADLDNEFGCQFGCGIFELTSISE